MSDEEPTRPGVGRILWDATEILVLLAFIGGCCYCALRKDQEEAKKKPAATAPAEKGGPRGTRRP